MNDQTRLKINKQRRAGAMPVKMNSGDPRDTTYRRSIEITDAEIARCRKSLQKLRRILLVPGNITNLVTRGLQRIKIWDPKTNQTSPEFIFDEPLTQKLVPTAVTEINALLSCLLRPCGIDELARQIGVREFMGCQPVDLVCSRREKIVDGPLMYNHISADIWPNSDYSITGNGEIWFHS